MLGAGLSLGGKAEDGGGHTLKATSGHPCPCFARFARPGRRARRRTRSPTAALQPPTPSSTPTPRPPSPLLRPSRPTWPDSEVPAARKVTGTPCFLAMGRMRRIWQAKGRWYRGRRLDPASVRRPASRRAAGQKTKSQRAGEPAMRQPSACGCSQAAALLPARRPQCSPQRPRNRRAALASRPLYPETTHIALSAPARPAPPRLLEPPASISGKHLPQASSPWAGVGQKERTKKASPSPPPRCGS